MFKRVFFKKLKNSILISRHHDYRSLHDRRVAKSAKGRSMDSGPIPQKNFKPFVEKLDSILTRHVVGYFCLSGNDKYGPIHF